METCAKA